MKRSEGHHKWVSGKTLDEHEEQGPGIMGHDQEKWELELDEQGEWGSGMMGLESELQKKNF